MAAYSLGSVFGGRSFLPTGYECIEGLIAAQVCARQARVRDFRVQLFCKTVHPTCEFSHTSAMKDMYAKCCCR